MASRPSESSARNPGRGGRCRDCQGQPRRYNWLGGEKLYNPFGILKLFASRRFRAHWFETAAPRFLVDTLLKHGFAAPDLESVRADEDLLSAFEAERA